GQVGPVPRSRIPAAAARAKTLWHKDVLSSPSDRLLAGPGRRPPALAARRDQRASTRPHLVAEASPRAWAPGPPWLRRPLCHQPNLERGAPGLLFYSARGAVRPSLARGLPSRRSRRAGRLRRRSSAGPAGRAGGSRSG